MPASLNRIRGITQVSCNLGARQFVGMLPAIPSFIGRRSPAADNEFGGWDVDWLGLGF